MLPKYIRIAYLSSDDPTNKKIWSGTHYSIYTILINIGEVEILGPYEPKYSIFLMRILNQVYLRLFKKRISYRHSKFISKKFAVYFTKRLLKKKFDIIIAPAASAEIAFLETTIPIIYITDGTFSVCAGYHKNLSQLTKKSTNEGNLIEQLAIDKSRFVIVSSEWASHSVTQDYHKDKNAVKTIPFGANFEVIPSKINLFFENPKIWRLFFIGLYWENKGGNIAYNAFKTLIDKGYNVELTVLGCLPPDDIKHDKLNVIPFIDKNSTVGQIQMKEIYNQQHFLILPTRFDCTPIVINEASAFGIPSLVADTGGVAGHLKNNINGFLISYDDNGEQYAAKIEYLINNPTDYLALRNTTRDLYDKELNWQHWSEELKKIIATI